MSSPDAAPTRRGSTPRRSTAHREPGTPLRPGVMRRWLAARTLRGRLIAGLLALLALACAAVGLVTYLVLSHTLINQLDLQLHAAGGRYASCMEDQTDHGHEQPRRPPPGNCNRTPGLGAGTFGARVKHGEVTNQGIIDGSSHLSAADQAKLVKLPPDGHFYTLDLPSIGGDYRVTAVPGHDHDVLITGLPLSDYGGHPAPGGNRRGGRVLGGVGVDGVAGDGVCPVVVAAVAAGGGDGDAGD